MAFMELQTTHKGALYSCDCRKCGARLQRIILEDA